MTKVLKLHQRMKLLLGITYRCRCGALVPKASRKLHEEFHDACRDFFRPPTLAEMERAAERPADDDA